MTTQDVVILAISIAIAVIAVLGALAIWRTLRSVGTGMRAISADLDARAERVPQQIASLRSQLDAVDVHVEHALWMLENLDDRIAHASVGLRSQRATSDSLRLRLIEGRLTVARIRQLMRLVIRLGELRRAIL